MKPIDFISDFEKARLEEVKSLNLLQKKQTGNRLDQFTNFASRLFDAPIALVSIIDRDKQWYMAKCGIKTDGSSRDIAFCNHAIKEEKLMVVEDAKKDERFKVNPYVTGDPHIRFYAGAVLRGPKGYPIGTLCVVDDKSRKISEREQDLLLELAKMVESEIISRRHEKELHKNIKNEIKSLLYTDPATGLPTRGLLRKQMEQTIKLCDLYDSYLIVGCIGITNYKSIMASYGEQFTYQLINKLVYRIKDIYPKMTLSRWADNEFMFFKPIKKDDRIDLRSLGERILHNCSMPLRVEEEEHNLRCTIGLSQYPEDGDKVDELLDNASGSLLNHLYDSDSRVFLFRDETTSKRNLNAQVESELRKAIINNDFNMVYQPIIDLKTGNIVAAEALCRWDHKELGPISPNTFIPVAESAGLISGLDRWIISKVCSMIQSIEKEMHTDFSISVNITEKTLRQESFIAYVEKLLNKTGINPGRLSFEITERVIIHDLEEIIRVMNAFKEMGVTFSIDDYGTGHSSLRYLQALPVKTLKIDKRFVENLYTSTSDRVIFKSTVSMAHALGLEVLAEGVETHIQYEIVSDMDCDLCQGFLFSKPLELDLLLQFTEEKKSLQNIRKEIAKNLAIHAIR